MGCNPNVQLLEARLPGFFEIAHDLPVLRAILDVESRPKELIVIRGALVYSEPAYGHAVRTHRPEQPDAPIERTVQLL